jgi:cell volume regulation protein A
MVVALAASLLAGRLRVPALLLFLAIGMVIGTDGLGWLDFDDYELARDVGIIALALILFEGGLSTNVDQLKRVALPAISLAVFGTLLTALITGLAAASLFQLSVLEGLLLGSIVASTDAAAIFAMLRTSGLKPRLTRLLEGEAGGNDPVAILLVIGFIEWIGSPDYGVSDLLSLFLSQAGIGAVVGVAVGWCAVKLLRTIELPTAGLYPVASLTAGGLAFGAADTMGGSGFLAIYLTGLALSASVIPAKRTINAFHDGLAWVAQLAMFLTLGLLVFPSQLGSIALEGSLLALILVFVARPIASVAATPFVRLGVGERILLGWAGLRGAVPVVLATFPVIADIPGSLEFFNIVFFAVVLSLLVQGPTFEPLARRLDLTTARPALPGVVAEITTIRKLGAEVIDYLVGPDDAAAGARVRELALPREAVVNVIIRADEAIPPRGSTQVKAGDHVYVLVRREARDEVAELMQRWHKGPLDRRILRRSRRARSAAPIFSVRPFDPTEVVGEVSEPSKVAGKAVAARLRVRRDQPGALVALEDGRYAITGPILVFGSRTDVSAYASRRLRHRGGDEHAWYQSIVGALAIDAFEPPGDVVADSQEVEVDDQIQP